MSDGKSVPADAVLVFGADGRLIASTAQEDQPHRPVRTLGDLEAQFRQTDGMPVHLAAPTRQVGVPQDGVGPRVLLVSESLSRASGGLDDPSLAVLVVPFRDEEDPRTLQRALGSVLAHQMRTPMTTIYAGSELLARRDLPESARTEAASTVVLAAEQLHAAIEDLVLLVRWSADALTDPGPVLLGPILRRHVERRHGAGATIDVRLPADLVPVRGTDEAVTHLVRNVVDHAVGNAPADGRVTIAAHADGEWVELRVTDDGPARTAAERNRAFDLFAPTRRQAADPSGANLSMVVARRLVERMNGTIRADPGEGGITVVRLPAAV